MLLYSKTINNREVWLSFSPIIAQPFANDYYFC